MISMARSYLPRVKQDIIQGAWSPRLKQANSLFYDTSHAQPGCS
jgi:hypothetical protein